MFKIKMHQLWRHLKGKSVLTGGVLNACIKHTLSSIIAAKVAIFYKFGSICCQPLGYTPTTGPSRSRGRHPIGRPFVL